MTCTLSEAMPRVSHSLVVDAISHHQFSEVGGSDDTLTASKSSGEAGATGQKRAICESAGLLDAVTYCFHVRNEHGRHTT